MNDIVKEYHPESSDVNFEFLTQDQDNVTISLSTPEHLFNHPKFHMNWNVVLFVTGWNTNTSDEIVSALYDAYRCRGGYNFVVKIGLEFSHIFVGLTLVWIWNRSWILQNLLTLCTHGQNSVQNRLVN